MNAQDVKDLLEKQLPDCEIRVEGRRQSRKYYRCG
jgi:acid stress-induced BolA-like protein IbaG/YrbA